MSDRCKKCGRIKGKNEHKCTDTSWNKGKKLTKEHIEKLRLAKLGKKLSPEHREKLAKHLRSLDNPYRFKKGMVPFNKGKRGVRKPPPKYIPKGRPSGERHYLWKKDRTTLKDDHKDRGGQLHREWSRSVKKRDCWKCRINNSLCSGKLEAHHIYSWSKFPELRYNIHNGITLCHYHHQRKKADAEKLAPLFIFLLKLT